MTAQPVTLAPHTTADNVTAGLRVAYVITRSDSIGGGHIHIRDVALALRARGGEPFVLVGGQGPFTDELRRLQIPYRSLRRSEEHTSELQSHSDLVCRLLL